MISVVLPTHNRADVLRRSIDSVLCQTYPDIELIVVDDGSTDKTHEVIAGVDDRRLREIIIEQRSGAPAARNKGIRASAGEFIAFQDSDDEWLAKKLAQQLEIFERLPERYGVVYTSFRIVGRLGKIRTYPSLLTRLASKLPYKKTRLQGNIQKSLRRGNFITTQSALVRRECFDQVGMFDESLPRFQDWDLWLRMSHNYSFAYIQKPLIKVYSMPGNISDNKDALVTAFELLLIKHLNGSCEDNDLLGQYYFALGDLACLEKEEEKGREYFREAIRLSPANLAYRFAWFASRFGPEIYRRVAGISGFSYPMMM